MTMLKASGLSDVFAREIVGHESAAVSRQYTHLTTDDLARGHAAVAGRYRKQNSLGKRRTPNDYNR